MTFDKIVSLISEDFPLITKRGQSVLADHRPLKGLKLEDVKDNIVFLRQDVDSDFLARGFTLVYFMDSSETAEKMAKGELPYLLVPAGTNNPITDVWKNKFAQPGTEHILGIIQGNTNEEIIYIHMMTVRDGYRRNGINSHMINILKKRFPNAELEYSKPTSAGSKFIQNFK